MIWMPVDVRPKAFVNILLTDGQQVFEGWCETTEPFEELSFVRCEKDYCVNKITHWMELPKPPKKEKKMESKAKKKVKKVMKEFKNDKLHSGSKKGPLVKSGKQAIAIALSETGKSKKKK